MYYFEVKESLNFLSVKAVAASGWQPLALESLIKTHNAQCGTLININVISRDMILAAHADPDLYPDLVVRVTGFSAYFRSLSPEYRQLVVDRVLSEG